MVNLLSWNNDAAAAAAEDDDDDDNAVLFLVVDDTRVRLSDGDPDTPGSDYINANHITVAMLIL